MTRPRPCLEQESVKMNCCAVCPFTVLRDINCRAKRHKFSSRHLQLGFGMEYVRRRDASCSVLIDPTWAMVKTGIVKPNEPVIYCVTGMPRNNGMGWRVFGYFMGSEGLFERWTSIPLLNVDAHRNNQCVDVEKKLYSCENNYKSTYTISHRAIGKSGAGHP